MERATGSRRLRKRDEKAEPAFQREAPSDSMGREGAFMHGFVGSLEKAVAVKTLQATLDKALRIEVGPRRGHTRNIPCGGGGS